MGGRRKTREGISSQEEWVSLQTCVNQFAGAFGYMPLVDSLLRYYLASLYYRERGCSISCRIVSMSIVLFRLDPVLFKDPVSNLRKKYKALEGAP